MFRISAGLVALVLACNASTAMAIDCLSYLAADAALDKANNDSYADYRKTVQAAEATWQAAVQHRETAWQAAGRAAAAALYDADAAYRSALDSADRDLKRAHADANADRELAVANAWTALTETVDKARTKIIGADRTATFRKAWRAFRQATTTALADPDAVPDYPAVVRAFLKDRLVLDSALAEMPVEARDRYHEIRIGAEVKHREAVLAANRMRRESYAAATATYREAVDGMNRPSDSGAAHLKAGKDAYTEYWHSIHDAYFAYQDVLDPAKSRRSAAEAQAREEWKQAYIGIYQNPNIGLQRTSSGRSQEDLFTLAEAERRLCPY